MKRLKVKKSPEESRKSQGPFEGSCKVQLGVMACHGSCGGHLLCPESYLILCLECIIKADIADFLCFF